MAAYVFTPTPVTGGATVRFDTASGSTTPATVYPLGRVDAWRVVAGMADIHARRDGAVS